MGTFTRVRCHQFWVKFVGVIAQFCNSNGFQTSTSLREITVTVDPSKAIHMHTVITLVDVFAVLSKADFCVHVDSQDARSGFNERPIEEVTVICSNNCGLSLFNVFEEPLYNSPFIRLVENHKWTGIFRLWRIFEVADVLRDYLTVRDQESLAINHIRNHHNLVDHRIGEFQW